MAESAAISIDGKCWMGEPMQAILDGNLDKLKILLEGKNVDEVPCVPESFTLLHIAVGSNQMEIVKYLLKMKADPNKVSDIGITPIHLCIMWNYPEMLKLLFKHSENRFVNENGNDLLEIATENKSHECAEILQNYLKESNFNKNSVKCNKITACQDQNQYEIKNRIQNEKLDLDDYDTLSKKFESFQLTSRSSVKKNKSNDRKYIEDNFISENDFEQLSNNEIRQQLLTLGDNPGPIVDSTRKLYIKRLIILKSKHKNNELTEIFAEISLILKDKLNLLHCIYLEKELCHHFEDRNLQTKWKGGIQKSSFIYFLLDSRITRDLPSRSHDLSFWEIFETFIISIFYVGKGKQIRPYKHLIEALNYKNKKNVKLTSKIKQIENIWTSGHGIISLHCFHNIISAEAHTREACILDALGLSNLTNQKRGIYYGIAESWSMEDKKKFGFYLLYRALSIFINEGERQLFEYDLKS